MARTGLSATQIGPTDGRICPAFAESGNGLENIWIRSRLLSGGQRQALSLLMASLKQPELLLLDEHTAALDPKTSQSLMQLTDELIATKGMTALMVTHQMEDALRHGNRLIVMKMVRLFRTKRLKKIQDETGRLL